MEKALGALGTACSQATGVGGPGGASSPASASGLDGIIGMDGAGCIERIIRHASDPREALLCAVSAASATASGTRTDTSYAELAARVRPLAAWFQLQFGRAHEHKGSVPQDCLGEAPTVACFVDSG